MKDAVKIKLSCMDDVKEFSSICERYEEIENAYIIGRYVIDAKSILGILSTSLGKIANVKIHTRNQDTLELFLNSISKWIVEASI